MSSSSSENSTFTIATLSPHELSRLVTEPTMNPLLNEAFHPGSETIIMLRYYASISETIDTLERELERHRLDREDLFENLTENRRFRRRMVPIVNDFRQLTGHRRRTRYHPYGQTPSPPRTPSNPASVHPPSSVASVVILPEEALARIPSPIPPATSASSIDSYKTAIDEPLGSPGNPIIIPDDGDDICTRCYQTDHLRDDCLTPIPLNEFCEACEWRGTPQEECRHTEIAPGWVKRINAELDLQEARGT
jgi:hypothetical protein